ncbi:Prolyl 4-hydroxylase 5 [Cocos nucifera]|uniref:procollagen-proline 4-dioxygenase n=1 Tax=Cocos nucifera TaxID=13894 RepID=A0A8K0II85_COCNU|nr:Prolyl 4-hydroxylase 5 [Cocos nucifera]
MAFSRPSLMARGVRHPRMFTSRRSSSYTLALTILLILSVVLLMLLALGIFSLPVHSDSASEAADIHGVRSVYKKTTKGGNGLGNRGGQWTEVISWEPRAFIFHNFLSKEECEDLINLAKPHMEKSTVVDSATGKSKDSRVRTSSGTFLQRGRDKIIRDIEKRIADYTFMPVEHGEGLQVLHYEVGQKYEPHFDYFLDDFNTKNGGQRMATLLMYLSDVEEGGETVFPSAKVNSSSLPWFNELSECGKEGLSVRPKMGDALLFWSMKPDATLDPLSLHGGCPVIKGNKWSATKWIRVHEYKV